MRYIYVCGLLAAAVTAQAGDYRPPRLADGQVDLQGVWSHRNITPLERPAELKTFVITRDDESLELGRTLERRDVPVRPHTLQIDLAVGQSRRPIVAGLRSDRGR